MTFTVDVRPSWRLTRLVRLPVIFAFAVAVLAAGCATAPKTGFDAVPAPSANAAPLPANSAVPPAAPSPTPARLTKASYAKSSTAKNGAETTLLITPDPVLTGRVASFNAAGQFVVLNFPVGHLPLIGQRLGAYRLGVKVGEVKVTGPQRDDHIVADVTTGEVQAGDEVRER